MLRITKAAVGISQGDVEIFSEFDTGGDMWTGSGDRERRRHIAFDRKYTGPPAVHVTISMWDLDSGPNIRIDATADNISASGFDLVFRTWSDTRVARARMSWLAIGELGHHDDWDV